MLQKSFLPQGFLLFCAFFFFQCQNPKTPAVSEGKSTLKLERKVAKKAASKETALRLKADEIKKDRTQLSAIHKDQVIGYFTYAADAANFFPCGMNDRYPVLSNAEYLKMESQYIRLKDLGFAEKVYVKLLATYKVQQGMEGKPQKILEVKQFLGFERGKKCE